MKRRWLLPLLALGVCLAGPGCTSRAWYEGFQAAQRQQCYKRVTPEEVRRCLDQVNGTTYDDYKRARDKVRRSDK